LKLSTENCGQTADSL